MTIFNLENFEDKIAKANLKFDDVLYYLDHYVYFKLLRLPILGLQNDEIAKFLINDGIIVKQANSLFSITNLGAILFARNLKEFGLERKALRFINYDGISKIRGHHELIDESGYAIAFNRFFSYVLAFVPSKEDYESISRIEIFNIPSNLLKELILNALIHQDFTIDGSGVMIECFSNRIEITNPGAPLIDVNKIADSHHLSRNPKLVNLMDKLGFNNDLTAGWDTVIQTCEKYCLPAPGFKIFDEFTQVTVYPPTEFKDISFDEKLWTCFLHALYCLKQNEFMTKSSLKKRFGLKSNQNYSISKLIKSAIDKNLLAIVDPTVTSRYLKFRLGSKYNLK